MKIKASQITNLTDARYFAAREVEWVSFDFRENSINYIEPMKARAMFEWIEGPIIVGEFDNLTADEIRFYTESWGLKAIQLGVFSSLDIIKSLKDIPIIKEFWIEEFTNATFLSHKMSEYADYVYAFQLNFEKGNLSWADLKKANAMLTVEDLKGLCEEYRIIIDIPFEITDLIEIGDLLLSGLSVKGSAEERVGVKTFDELDEIFDALEQSY